MIDRTQAFDLLVESCPSYFATDRLGGFVSSFEDAGTPDVYVRTTAFAHHLVHLIEARDMEEVGRVFSTVERLLAEADPDAAELVTLGLLEPLANIVSHRDVGVSAGDVESVLGAAAGRVWAENAELWVQAARWRHDGGRVAQIDYDGVADSELRRYLQAHKRRMDDDVLLGASDVVRYQSELAGISPLTPAGRPRIPVPAVLVGIVLALALAIALYR